MSESKDTIPLVRQAQQGHAEARGELLRIVEPRLAEYVGRLTLDRDLTTDIVQESITEMLKIFDTLKDPERFWCWLYTITLNKVRGHYRRRWRRRETSLSEVHEEWFQAKDQDALAELVTQELKEIVLRSVGQLEPRQRAVLTMRCYDQMSYEQISAALGCSALGARALFCRAKKTLTRLLRAHGIDKSALPVALLIFGKFSATSEAAAAGITISAAMLRVGFWGMLAGAAASPLVMALLAGAALVGTGGAYLAGADLWKASPPPATVPAEISPARAVSQDSSCWYYYPPGQSGTVMIRSTDQTAAYRQWLQKEQANYYRRGNTIYIRNHRQFATDLAVWRLPTDPPAQGAFLKAQDGRDPDLEYVAAGPRGLLISDYFGFNHWRSPEAFGSCECLPGAEVTAQTHEATAYWFRPSQGPPDRTHWPIKLQAGFVDGHVEAYRPGDTAILEVADALDGSTPALSGFGLGAGQFYVPQTAATSRP